MTSKRSYELLYFWPSHIAIPALGLNVNHIQSKPIFFDDTVYTAITTPAFHFTGIFSRSAITHTKQQINDITLKKGWGSIIYLLQQISRKCRAELAAT